MKTSTTTTTTTTTTGLILAAVLLCCSQAIPAGETCTSSFGVSFNESETWKECLLDEACCFNLCTCSRTDGLLTIDCAKACHGVQFPHPGCSIGKPFQNSTFHECCPIECPPETCTSSFGVSFSEGDTWTECLLDQACCFNFCTCRPNRTNGDLTRECHKLCRGEFLRPGCSIGTPFQNSTSHNCCPIECNLEPPQCTSSFGQTFNIGERWDECSPGKKCCTKSCECVVTGNSVEPLCFEACASTVLGQGCRLIESFQNATDMNCCRTECPDTAAETCVSAFGQKFLETQTWNECSPGRNCCSKSCECIRYNGTLIPLCGEACPFIVLPPGCSILDPVQDPLHRDCCVTNCPPVPHQCTSSFGQTFNIGERWKECSPGTECCTKSCDCVLTINGVGPRCFEACPSTVPGQGCRVIEPFQNATYMDCCRTDCPGGISQT